MKEDCSIPIGWSLQFLRSLRSLRWWKPRLTVCRQENHLGT